jgi:SAM-dependent methyltransferase
MNIQATEMADRPVPLDHLRKHLRDIRTFEAAYIIGQLVAGRPEVLCVGDEWGRDYYTLTAQGHRVHNVDIAWQPHLPTLTIADTARALPFADGTFDAVVMAEVVEHLFDDVTALSEARRVLRDDGLLTVTVPFFNDAPEYHVRLHSARTIRRLLAHAGFQATQIIHRGGWISFPRLVGLLGRVLNRDAVLRTFAQWDYRWGQHDSRLMRKSRYYGAYIAARKGERADYRGLNASEFSLEATLSRMV